MFRRRFINILLIRKDTIFSLFKFLTPLKFKNDRFIETAF